MCISEYMQVTCSCVCVCVFVHVRAAVLCTRFMHTLVVYLLVFLVLHLPPKFAVFLPLVRYRITSLFGIASVAKCWEY